MKVHLKIRLGYSRTAHYQHRHTIEARYTISDQLSLRKQHYANYQYTGIENME